MFDADALDDVEHAIVFGSHEVHLAHRPFTQHLELLVMLVLALLGSSAFHHDINNHKDNNSVHSLQVV